MPVSSRRRPARAWFGLFAPLMLAGGAAAQDATSASAASRKGESTELKTIEQARAEAQGPLSQRVLEYSRRFGEILELGGKRPLTNADWEPLGELLDKSKFERVGGYNQTMGWNEYLGLLNGFGNASTWQGKVRRITEAPGRVYLELVESGQRRDGSGSFVTNTLTVYEFDDQQKLVRLWVYLQGTH